MSDEENKKLNAEQLFQRDLLMFKAWLQGKPYRVLAAENDLSLQGVYLIARKYKWREAREELKQRQFKESLSQYKSTSMRVDKLFQQDLSRIEKEMEDNRRSLHKEERDHLRAYQDRILKEIRLDEGKPTELSSGPTRVEISLPPGVKRFGIIPPAANVNYVEHKPAEEQEKQIDLDEIEAEMIDESEDE